MPIQDEDIEQTLIIIKPDGIFRSLTGNIITMLSHPNDIIVAAKIVTVTREVAEKHYQHLKEKPFFTHLVSYFTGEWHVNRVLAMVYEGKGVIQRIRDKAGATNPEEASPNSIRGRFGRIHSKTGVFENVIHCSENKSEAEREIKLWFQPSELVSLRFPTATIKQQAEILVWK
jgi:nucleoside-diphosphate kinase